MAMPLAQRRWTAAEVRELIADNPLYTPRYELVEGELLVTPGPAHIHQRAVAELLAALLTYTRDTGIGVALASPSDVELEPEFLTQPDVYVISTDEWKRARAENVAHEALLIVEVLSPSSSRHDRVRKRPLYQRNVPEYWIVDLDARVIERWRTGDERPEIAAERIDWQPAGADVALRLDLADLFRTVLD